MSLGLPGTRSGSFATIRGLEFDDTLLFNLPDSPPTPVDRRFGRTAQAPIPPPTVTECRQRSQTWHVFAGTHDRQCHRRANEGTLSQALMSFQNVSLGFHIERIDRHNRIRAVCRLSELILFSDVLSLPS